VSVSMVDISGKDKTYREAVAEGKIYLRKETIERIFRNQIEKGDIFTISKVAAIQAVKKTSEILPLCHPIDIFHIDVDIKLKDGFVKVIVRVKSYERTGVEMEALNGVTVALLNIWDMVKKYEKDNSGNYPFTKITDVRVVSKVKKQNNQYV